jgi:catechol 2,3-dioxygenase-like lactoylglutathione lyase family enzyme
MAKLRHIAICVRDIDKAAAFYQKVFGMKQVGREDLEMGSGLYLSDGVVNLALLSYKPGVRAAGAQDGGTPPPGPHHFGFIVDDLEASQREIEAAGGQFFFKLGDNEERPNFELKFKDPEGIIFDISQKGWLGTSNEV